MERTPFESRFCGRADVYSRYRPQYPNGIIPKLEEEIDFNREKIVADVGTGTGLLAELFLRNGNKVWGVEPNPEMRSGAVETLSGYKNFVAVVGSAEHTTLESSSIDLVTVGQALHWFDQENSKKEFSRILKAGDYVAIVYNERKNLPGLMADYQTLVERHAADRIKPPEKDDSYLTKFFGTNQFKKFTFPNSQLLDAEGLIGRASSASYFPKPGDDSYQNLRIELLGLFSKYQSEGKVELIYDTLLFLGKI
jgi:SAM-dependent methyltransferase